MHAVAVAALVIFVLVAASLAAVALAERARRNRPDEAKRRAMAALERINRQRRWHR